MGHHEDTVWEDRSEVELSCGGARGRGQGREVVSVNEIMSGVQQNL